MDALVNRYIGAMKIGVFFFKIQITVVEIEIVINRVRIMVNTNLVSRLHLFPLKFLDHGPFGRMKKIASKPNL